MKLKRILALLMSGATLWGLLIFPAPAKAADSSYTAFTDIQDQKVAQAAETLRLLGVVSGTGSGAFEPGRTLTRAEFCKMAVELMGNGDKAASQMNRTIFKDVPSTHWARGYIAVATQSSDSGTDDTDAATAGIIRGDAYGNFNPDRAITYAEAVTILVRILGYGDADVGLVWPNGYLAKAGEVGLSDGVKLPATDAPTRGQAAILMDNLLYADTSAGKEYLTSLGCSTVKETVVFDISAVAPDGSDAVKVTDSKVYKTGHAPFDPDLEGRRVELVLDKDDKVISIRPSNLGTTKVVTLQSLAYDSMKTTGGGSEIDIDDPAEVPVWQPDKDATTYDKLYLSGAAAGTQAVLQYSAAGELEYIFLRSSAKSEGSTQVIKNQPSYSGQESYSVYKNGVAATTKDIRQYDVTTFVKASNSLYVSDVRVTGVYENVYPNADTPATVTVLGHDFTVLSSAAADLRSFKLGDSVTLLLDYNGRVAGAVAPTTARSTAVGTVDSIDSNGAATVTAINLRENGKFVTLSGDTSYKDTRAQDMLGQLVTISSSGKGRLNLSKLSGGASTSPLNVLADTMGTVKLSDSVRLYEQVGVSQLVEIQKEDITRNTVPASQITYVHTDYAGRADIVVFNDVTGDRFTYGFADVSSESSESSSLGDGDTATTITIRYVQVKNAQHTSGTDKLVYQEYLRSGVPIGVVEGARRIGDSKRTAGSVVTLLKREVSSDAFDMDAMTVTLNDMILPVAENVQCYNDASGTWFSVGTSADEDDFKAALNLARAFSDTVTLYYDKAPDQGGKVRLVVVE